MKLRLAHYDDNTFEDTDGSCEVCTWSGMMDHPTYLFIDSDGGEHVVEGWWKEWGFLYSYDVNVPVFAHWLHDAEFKDEIELDHYDYLVNEHYWDKLLKDILDSASYCPTEAELTKNIAWALKGANNAD